MNILVVEDNHVLCCIELRYLQRVLCDCQFFSAATALDAVKIVEEYPPSLVVLDCGLPDAAGTDVMEMLLPYSPNAMFIITSAQPPSLHTLQLLTPNVLLLKKPFDPEQLTSLAARALNQTAATPHPIRFNLLDQGQRKAQLNPHDILNTLAVVMADICVMEADLLSQLESPTEIRSILSQEIPPLKQSVKLAAKKIRELLEQ